MCNRLRICKLYYAVYLFLLWVSCLVSIMPLFALSWINVYFLNRQTEEEKKKQSKNNLWYNLKLLINLLTLKIDLSAIILILCFMDMHWLLVLIFLTKLASSWWCAGLLNKAFLVSVTLVLFMFFYKGIKHWTQSS